jgi:anti-sigma B factor antagonist
VNAGERFRVSVRSEADRVVVQLQGELDLAGSPLLAGELERAEADSPALVVLDVSALDFIDSAGLRVILAANMRLRERGAELVLTPTRPQVERLLSVAGVEDRLRVVPSSAAALLPPSNGSAPAT